MTKIRFIRSTAKVNEAGIPKVKLADKTFMEYDEYVAKKKAEREGGNNSVASTSSSQEGTMSGDDLPF